MRRLALSFLLLAAGCGGHTTNTLEYDGHLLEPRSILFAQLPEGEGQRTIAVISDRSDTCQQFEGLACVQQPYLGTTLVFDVPGFSPEDFTVDQGLRARWYDLQGVRPLEGWAESGTLSVDETRLERSFGGTFDLTLPAGKLDGAFTARHCEHLRDYYRDCPPPRGGDL
jgi:hypothetical protein